jgi:hypothetical protein
MQLLRNLPPTQKIIGLIILIFLSGGSYTVIRFLDNKNPSIGIPGLNESEYKEVNITVRDKSNENLIPAVDVEISGEGPPEVKKTDTNGYVEIKIPTRNTVEVRLSQKDYDSERYMVNLQTDRNTTKTFYMEPKTADLSKINSTPTSKVTSTPNGSSTSIPPLAGLDLPKSSPGSIGNDIFPDKYVGNWAGIITYKNTRNNSSQKGQSTMGFVNGKVGSKIVSFYGNGCWRTLILISVKSNSVELFENITSGNCDSGGITTIKLLGNDLMEFRALPPTGSSITAIGTLTRQ